MSFFKSIVVSALAAGIIAGAVLTGFQTLKVYPLIFEAEKFEVSEIDVSAHSHASEEEANTNHDHSQVSAQAVPEDEEWMPADGMERFFYSLNSNVILGIGLGLVLAAIFALRGIIDWRQGVIWGVAGFVTVNLAPALGLPPELPGMPAGDLIARQMWWWSTVSSTAVGLALIFLNPKTLLHIAGACLLVIPHVVGAPHPDSIESLVPANLAADFATASLAMNMIFWAILGAVIAMVLARLNRDEVSPA